MEELQTQRLRICAFDKRYLEDYALYLTEEITRYQYPDPFASLEDVYKRQPLTLKRMSICPPPPTWEM